MSSALELLAKSRARNREGIVFSYQSAEGAMPPTVIPMLNVPDVRSTALWYQSVGFDLIGWHENDAEGMGIGPLPEPGSTIDWACLSFGNSEVMLNAGGEPGDSARREVSLYVHLDTIAGGPDVDTLHAGLKDRVEVTLAPYDAFHGHREFAVRDPNGFSLVFAQPVARRSTD